MVKGQRWKVLEREGVIAREGPEERPFGTAAACLLLFGFEPLSRAAEPCQEYCRILPEALPAGAVASSSPVPSKSAKSS